MNHNTKKHVHEKNRKRHKTEMLEHARAAAKRGPSKLPFWFLVVGIAALVAAVGFLTFR
jgi:hypothetical protein